MDGVGKSDCRKTQQEARVVDLVREDSDFYRDIRTEKECDATCNLKVVILASAEKSIWRGK